MKGNARRSLAVLVLGRFIFYPNGPINAFLGLFGIKGPLWLANPRLIIPASVMLAAWQCGTAMVVYLGALQNVPAQYYEAAEIDGLGRVRQFFGITIPLISPTIFFGVIIDLIFALTIFIPALVLPEGRRAGRAGRRLALLRAAPPREGLQALRHRRGFGAGHAADPHLRGSHLDGDPGERALRPPRGPTTCGAGASRRGGAGPGGMPRSRPAGLRTPF